MTQLALLLVLGLLGSLLSFAFGRLEVKRGPVSATVKRAEGALERASVALLRLGGVRGLGLLVVPALGLSAFAWLSAAPSTISSSGRAAFCAVCLVAGGLSALAQARLALAFGARAASSAAAARARGSARTMRPLLRASVASAVFGDGLGLLGLAAVFSALYAIRGGFAAAAPNAALATDIARLLPAFALGAGVTALVLAREGSVASAAARVGARPSELDASATTGDARNPALLAQLMGQLVGELLPCAQVSYVGGLVATTSATLFAVAGVAGSAGAHVGLLLLVAVRAFGAVASVCGVLAARVTDDEPPLRALLRGQLCAAAVGAFGLGAALFWLMREHWGTLFVAGAVGLCCTLAVAVSASWPIQRRPAAREESNGAGEAAHVARGLGVGFSSSWLSLLLPALAFAAIERASAAQVAVSALLISFVAGALILAPFAFALWGFGVLAQQTRGVVTLAGLEQEPNARNPRLDEASLLGRTAGGAQASLALGCGLLLGLGSLAAPASSGAPSLGSAPLAITLAATLLTVFGARAATSGSSGARLVTTEVERQFREAARTDSAAPSYKGCVDAALEAARSCSVLELALLLLCPFVLASLLRASSVPAGDGALAIFGVAAVGVGLIFTLGGRATRARLTEKRSRGPGNAAPAAAQPEYFGDLLGVTAATSVESLAFVLALTVLCLAPLLR